MNNLKSFKNCHLEQDIYVVASGKSVDFISGSFFDNKIVIGINQVYKKIKCNYLVRKEAILIKEVLANADKNTIHFISEGSLGNCQKKYIDETSNALKNIDTTNVVLYKHNQNVSHSILTSLPPDDMLLVTWSTITTGIHLAAYMGAKNIILVGHDCGTINNECNFSGYHTNETYKISWKNGISDYKIWLTHIEDTTIRLKKLLKAKYGCYVCSLNPFINFNLENNVYKK